MILGGGSVHVGLKRNHSLTNSKILNCFIDQQLDSDNNQNDGDVDADVLHKKKRRITTKKIELDDVPDAEKMFFSQPDTQDSVAHERWEKNCFQEYKTEFYQ